MKVTKKTKMKTEMKTKAKAIKKTIKSTQAKKTTIKTNTSKKNSNVNYDEVLKLSILLAKKAGLFLVKKQKNISSLKVSTKVAQGVASNADTGAEKIIIDGIKKCFPDHFILAEESAYTDYQGEMSRYQFLKEKEWVWIIDPLDGTHNFLNGLDYYCVCISLAHFGVPVVGVVYRPTSGECFTAIKEKGTKRLNLLKAKIKTTSIKKTQNKKNLKETMMVTGFITEKGQVIEAEFSLFKNMIGKTRGIRRMGSAALDLSYVALGIFDGFWERGLAAWDVSAAGLICLEAGVQVTDYYGQEFHPFQETIVAARSPIHSEILSLFSKSL